MVLRSRRTLGLLALITFVASVFTDNDPALFIGYFENKSDPKDGQLDAYLRAMEFDDFKRQLMKQYPVDIEIKGEADHKFSVAMVSKITRHKVTFALGQEQSAIFPNGQRYKLLVTKDGPKFTIHRQFKNFNSTTIANFEGNGTVRADHSAKNATVTVLYSRRH